MSVPQSNLRLVREHIPLEQGLRLNSIKLLSFIVFVREHIPLEQGLRHTLLIINPPFHIGKRAYSIRTRIKTPSALHGNSVSAT